MVDRNTNYRTDERTNSRQPAYSTCLQEARTTKSLLSQRITRTAPPCLASGRWKRRESRGWLSRERSATCTPDGCNTLSPSLPLLHFPPRETCSQASSLSSPRSRCQLHRDTYTYISNYVRMEKKKKFQLLWKFWKHFVSRFVDRSVFIEEVHFMTTSISIYIYIVLHRFAGNLNVSIAMIRLFASFYWWIRDISFSRGCNWKLYCTLCTTIKMLSSGDI